MVTLNSLIIEHHSVGKSFINSLIHGFAWGSGNRLSHILPIGIIILIIVAVVGFVIYQKFHQSK